LQTIYSPGGVQIRYKDPGICETTPGVKTYSGYIDLDATTHVFFWFLESRENPAKAPTTVWLTGGPGSDSMLAAFIGLSSFDSSLQSLGLTLPENGPCTVTDGTGAVYNPYSWSNHSNMIYLSQPLGTGFSYSKEAPGSLSPDTGLYVPPSEAPVTGG
jgi:carboxypeptidase C (cathepsin A)